MRLALVGGQESKLWNFLQPLFQRSADNGSLCRHGDLAAGLCFLGSDIRQRPFQFLHFGSVAQAVQRFLLIAENRAVYDLIVIPNQNVCDFFRGKTAAGIGQIFQSV